jgi:hypothetical protein
LILSCLSNCISRPTPVSLWVEPRWEYVRIEFDFGRYFEETLHQVLLDPFIQWNGAIRNVLSDKICQGPCKYLAVKDTLGVAMNENMKELRGRPDNVCILRGEFCYHNVDLRGCGVKEAGVRSGLSRFLSEDCIESL